MEQMELDLEWPEGGCERYRHVLGKVVRCTVPVEFYSDDWHDGMRSRVYVGSVCSCYRGGVCLQPPARQQGTPEERGQCFPVNSNMTFEVLPGKLSDYQ